MAKATRAPGKTTIAPDVLLTIARLTTLSVKGVSHMSPIPGMVNSILKRGHQSQGVRIKIEDDTVDVDIYVVLLKDVNIRSVSREIQKEVARAISEMVGMQVGQINIQIENINYS